MSEHTHVMYQVLDSVKRSDDSTFEYNVAVVIKRDVAVEVVKIAAAEKGHVYKNDQEALDDFLTIHYGQLITPEWERS